MARVKVNSFRDLIIGKPYHISIPSGTSLNCSNEYISFSSVSNIVTSITPVDDTTGGTTGYFGTAWASNMFYYNNKRYNFGQTSTASFECDVVISSLAFSNKYPMYADNLAQFFYIDEQKTLVPYLTSIANGYRTSSGSSSLINPQLFPLMMQHYTKPVSFISNTGDDEMTVISTVSGPTTSDLYLKPSVGYEGFWSTEKVLKISKPTQMTFPSSTSTSHTGTSSFTVSTSTSTRYINIPAGYNGSAKYITISAMTDGSLGSGITTDTDSQNHMSLVSTAGYLGISYLSRIALPSSKYLNVSLDSNSQLSVTTILEGAKIVVPTTAGTSDNPGIVIPQSVGAIYVTVDSYNSFNLKGLGSTSKAINLSGELGQFTVASGTTTGYFVNNGTLGSSNTNSLNSGTIGQSAYPLANTGTIYLGQNGTATSGSVYYKNNGGSSTQIVASGVLKTSSWSSGSSGTSSLATFTPSESTQYLKCSTAGWTDTTKYITVNKGMPILSSLSLTSQGSGIKYIWARSSTAGNATMVSNYSSSTTYAVGKTLSANTAVYLGQAYPLYNTGEAVIISYVATSDKVIPTSTKLEFALGTSSTTAPTSGWQSFTTTTTYHGLTILLKRNDSTSTTLEVRYVGMI